MHSELILDIDVQGHDSPELIIKRRAVVVGIVNELLQGKYHFLSIEGVPGIGKTYFVERIMAEIAKRGIGVALATMDMDVLPRSERRDLEITDYHPGDIAREAVLRHKQGTVSSFDFMEYDGATGEHSKKSRLVVPGDNNGLLIVEGFTSSLFIESMVGATADRVYEILLTGQMDLVEQQRLDRDLNKKGLPLEVMYQRLESQRRALTVFDADTQRRLSVSTPAVRRRPTHVKM